MPVLSDPSSPGRRSDAAEGLTAEMLEATVRRLARPAAEMGRDEIASALAAVCDQWRQRGFAPRSALVAEIAKTWNFSAALLQESFDALLAPFTSEAIAALAHRLPPYHKLVGFIMPGNVPGAGLHEVAVALTCGAPIIIKTASAEPFFFKRFTQTLIQFDPRFGSRLAVFNWPRDRADLTGTLREWCRPIVILGDDDTVEKIARYSPPTTVRFGTRMSGVIVAHEALAECGTDLPDAIARDASLFEQRGCLSPHHIFVEDADGSGRARCFASQLAGALERFAEQFPPPSALALEDAAALRRVRESARWRELGGHRVKLWEGRSLAWSVVYEDSASFQSSPGYRTLFVSPFESIDDLDHRLSSVAAKLEALAVGDPCGRLTGFVTRMRSAGLSYVCAPGMMQSPPVDWPHGGAALLDYLRRAV